MGARHARGQARWLAAVLCVAAMVAVACGSSGSGSDPASSDDGTDGASDTSGNGSGSANGGDDGQAAPTVTALSADDEGEPQRGGKVTLAINAESTGFNPLIDLFAIQTHFVASAIFDPLARVDHNGDAVAHLAESITPNDDATVWTITVPEGIVFHDGSPLDAAVVADNLQVRLDDVRGQVQFPLLEAVEQIDDRTVEVSMSAPWVAFDHLLTQQPGYVVSASMLEAFPEVVDPVGTGPFVFEDWIPDNRVQLSANDDYWQDGKPYLDELEFRVLTDPGTGYQSFTSGDIDALFAVDATVVGRLMGDDGIKLVVDGRNEENVVVLNAAVAPFDQIDARRAAVMAVDTDRFNEVLYDGVLPSAAGPFAEGEYWYDADTGYAGYDPDAAREAVAAYEEATGEPLRFDLGTISSSDAMANAQLLVEMWGEVGIDAGIEPVEQGLFITQVVTGQLQASRLSNFGYADPDFMYLFFHSSNASLPGEGIGTNFSYTIDEDLDEALDVARASMDRAVRRDAYGDMVRALNAQYAYIWLNHRVAAIATTERVNGLAVGESVGFGRVDSKPWLADIWVSSD